MLKFSDKSDRQGGTRRKVHRVEVDPDPAIVTTSSPTPSTSSRRSATTAAASGSYQKRARVPKTAPTTPVVSARGRAKWGSVKQSVTHARGIAATTTTPATTTTAATTTPKTTTQSTSTAASVPSDPSFIPPSSTPRWTRARELPLPQSSPTIGYYSETTMVSRAIKTCRMMQCHVY